MATLIHTTSFYEGPSHGFSFGTARAWPLLKASDYAGRGTVFCKAFHRNYPRLSKWCSCVKFKGHGVCTCAVRSDVIQSTPVRNSFVETVANASNCMVEKG